MDTCLRYVAKGFGVRCTAVVKLSVLCADKSSGASVKKHFARVL